jgi:hypothetical protein
MCAELSFAICEWSLHRGWLYVWVVCVACMCGLHVWAACVGCMCGLHVWAACVSCMCGLHVWAACVGCMCAGGPTLLGFAKAAVTAGTRVSVTTRGAVSDFSGIRTGGCIAC